MEHYIDDVFALVSLLVVWAGAAWQMIDVHVIDVAGTTSHFDGFLRRIVRVGSGAVDHEHAARWVSVHFYWLVC